MARGKGVKLGVTLTAEGKRSLSLMRELPERSRKMMSQLSYDAASEVKETLQRKIPGSSEYDTYRNSLSVEKFAGIGKIQDSFGIVATPKTEKARNQKANATIVFIKSRNQKSKTVAILEQFSPWTLDTLPFKPSQKQAVVRFRKVTPAEYEQIKQQRTQDRPRWSAALQRLPGTLDQEPELKGFPDVGFTALRLEFGLGGEPAVAHWRPAISDFVDRQINEFSRKGSKYNKVFSQLRNNAWMTWPTEVKKKHTYSKIKKYREFSKRLGVKV